MTTALLSAFEVAVFADVNVIAVSVVVAGFVSVVIGILSVTV